MGKERGKVRGWEGEYGVSEGGRVIIVSVSVGIMVMMMMIIVLK